MWGRREERRSGKSGAVACSAAMLAVVATAGCGGAQAPPAVRLALTAPTQGATVAVSNIKVFGTVDPANATVVVAGRHVHVAHGVFGRWITLHKGLSHIEVAASASGYAPAKLNVAVRSSPRSPAHANREGGTVATVTPVAGHRYDPRLQANLLHTCEASAGGTAAAETACECYLAQLEARVSQDTLVAAERAIVKGEAKLPRWLRDAALACRKG
jgi:hypothetical protein